ncbi:MAG TPA: RDD family protein [Streptosporangiaceae bacterium]
MTQPADNPGGQPAGDRSPQEQDAGTSASAPPPDSWHFPPAAQPNQPQPPAESTPPGQMPPDAAQPRGPQPPLASPPYGTPPPYGTLPPQSGAPPGYAPPRNGAPPGYGPPPQNGAPPQYGPPYAGPPQYSAPPYGTSPHYGTPPPYAGPQPYATPYPTYPAGLPVGPEPDLAERWRRLLGRLIDILVLTIVAAPIALAVLSHSFSQYQRIVNRYPDLNTPAAQAAVSKADGRLLGSWLVFACIVAVLSFFYDSIQHGLWGQTLGKRALGTRVVSADDRSKISGGTAAGRAAMYALIPVIPLVGTLFSLLNGLWLTWDRRRQALHDKAARTIVVKTSVPAPPGSPW